MSQARLPADRAHVHGVPLRTLLAVEFLVDERAVLVFRKRVGRDAARATRADPSDGPLPPPPDLSHNVVESLRANGFLEPAGTADGNESPWKVHERGRDALARSRKALAERRQADAERPTAYVVARRKGGPGVGALCRVARRTDKRAYVDEVRDGGVPGAAAYVYMGNYGERYVNARDVLCDADGPAAWEPLARATLEADRALAAAKSAMEARVAPIVAEHDARAALLASALMDEVARAFPGTGEAGPTRATEARLTPPEGVADVA